MSRTPGRIVLIGNPAAGRGRGALALKAAVEALSRRGHPALVYATEAPGHAVHLARRAAAETDLLLVAGGDGTLRDVAEGIQGCDVPVGLLPSGTGNDLARALGLSRALEPALEIALGDTERRLDVWRWNETLFANIAGVGLDAAVAATANRRFSRMRGTPAYLAAFLVTLPQFQPVRMRLEWPEGEWSGAAWLCAFASGTCYGGGLQIAPRAVPDDGLLDVVTISGIGKLELLRQFPKLFRGTHVGHPAVRIIRAASASIHTDPQDATIDGELISQAPARVTRSDHSLRIRVPEP